MTPVQNCGSFTLQQSSLCCRRSQKSASSGDFGTACSRVRLPANFIRHFLAPPRLRCASVILGYLFRDKISMGLESHSGNDRPSGTEHGRAGTEEDDVDHRSLAHSMIHASMLRHALSLLPPLRALTRPSSRTMSTYARNTLTRLYSHSPSSASATSSALLAPSAAAPPSPEARESLDSLAAHAQAAAEALACGSILAGHSSESDDYADVPLWLGAASERPEPSAVLRALGLEAWEEAGRVRSSSTL
jgi:hypothetical protein